MKKYIFLLVLFLCANTDVLTASDFYFSQQKLKSSQKELSQLINKRDKVLQKQKQLQVDYEEVLAQVEAHKEKPKSLPYKNAIKKSESLDAQIEQNNAELINLNQQIESLNQTVAEYEAELRSFQQTEAQQVSNDVKEEPIVEVKTKDVEEKPKQQGVALEENQSKGSSSSNTSKDNESEEDYTMVYIGVFVLFVLYIIYKIIKWVRWHKCPKCKKKWAMKVIDEQDCGIAKKEKVKKQDGTHEWVYYHKIKVTRECKHCGYQVWHTEVRKEA